MTNIGHDYIIYYEREKRILSKNEYLKRGDVDMSRFFIKGSGSYASADSRDYLLRRRILFISGDITEELAQETNRALLILASESREPITIVIDSGGGSTDAGLSIIDMMKLTGCRIKCICTCLAASMAAIIFSQGDERILLPHARVMLHETKISARFTAGSATLREMTDSLNQTDKVLKKLLADKTGRTLEEIEKACSFDNFMSAEQAIDFGLADSIADKLDMITEVLE